MVCADVSSCCSIARRFVSASVAAEPPPSVSTRPAGVTFSVEDDGPGIPDHMQERVFYPMVSGRAEGSGLGLSIAQDIVSRHQGSIQLHNEPGHTRFVLLLPFHEQGL